MRVLKTITEGGQIWAHRVRMAKQVLKIASFTSVVLVGLFFLGAMLTIPTVHYQASAYYLKAKVGSLEKTISVNGQFWGKVNHKPTSRAAVSKVCQPHYSFLIRQLFFHLQQSLSLGSYTFGGTVVFFLRRGVYGRCQQHLDGQQLVSPIRLEQQASPVT